jgi:hypothetical protein
MPRGYVSDPSDVYIWYLYKCMYKTQHAKDIKCPPVVLITLQHWKSTREKWGTFFRSFTAAAQSRAPDTNSSIGLTPSFCLHFGQWAAPTISGLVGWGGRTLIIIFLYQEAKRSLQLSNIIQYNPEREGFWYFIIRPVANGPYLYMYSSDAMYNDRRERS